MRRGTNPAKLEEYNKVKENYFHQVIVPVYIPKLKGYYKEGLEILKLCIESLYLTTHKKTFITVVNNGSCREVKDFLNELHNKRIINEIIHTCHIGKINSIIKGFSAHKFALVTITDADVLFKTNWQNAVYKIFENFPRAGVVGTSPNPKMIKYLTENVHCDNLFNREFKFRKVFSPDDLISFAKSIGNKYLFTDVHLNNILTIKKNDLIAGIGTGHFTATYKSELLNNIKSYYSNEKLGAKSDREALDIPSRRSETL